MSQSSADSVLDRLPTGLLDRFPTGLLDRFPTVPFFALALALSWAAWSLPILGVDAVPTMLAVAVGGFGPPVAAVVVTRARGESVRDLCEPILRWRVAPRWYAAALGVGVAGAAGTGVAFALAGYPLDPGVLPLRLATFAVGLLVTALVFGGQEELGWRGFAFPNLRERYSPLTASLVVGVVWAVWHLPLFAVDASSQHGLPFALYAPAVVAMSVLFAWLYDRSRGSLLLCMLAHAGVNNASVLVPVPRNAVPASPPVELAAAQLAVFVVLAVAVVAVDGRSLGYDDGRDAATERTAPEAEAA